MDVVEEDTEDGAGNTGLDLDFEDDTVNSDFDEDTDVTFEDGGTCVNRLGELSVRIERVHTLSKDVRNDPPLLLMDTTNQIVQSGNIIRSYLILLKKFTYLSYGRPLSKAHLVRYNLNI